MPLKRLAFHLNVVFLTVFPLPVCSFAETPDLFEIPLYFEPAATGGAFTGRMITNGSLYEVRVSASGLTFVPRNGNAVQLGWANSAKSARVEGVSKLPGVSHYYRGSDPLAWRSNVAHYQRVKVSDVYPGVDLLLRPAPSAAQSMVEYDFCLSPGADVNQISFDVEGATSTELDRDGNLVISAGGIRLLHRRPRTYQVIGGRQIEVASRFLLSNNHRVRFEIGDYDPVAALTIDPVIEFSTYLGGSALDYPRGMAVDSSGTVYLTGGTTSTDFPTQVPYQASKLGAANVSDVFVMKIDTNTRTILYSTYLGGAEDDSGYAIAIDGSGNAYVGGETFSPFFPLLNPYRVTFETSEAFVIKLNPSGGLHYSTFLGGNEIDRITSIKADSSGNVYVGGATVSTNFPMVAPYRSTRTGEFWDGFLAKLSPGGNSLLFSTYFGVAGSRGVRQISLDGSGNLWVVGNTESAQFPTQAPISGTTNASQAVPFPYVAKFNSTGSTLLFSTSLSTVSTQPGSAGDVAEAITFDAAGNAYVVGEADSRRLVLKNPIQATYGLSDCFVMKLTPSGGLTFSTLIGAASNDVCNAVSLDSTGKIWVGGFSLGLYFPELARFYSMGMNAQRSYLFQMANDGSAVLISSFLGSDNGQSEIVALGIDSQDRVYVTGPIGVSGFPLVQPLRSAPVSDDLFLTRISGQTSCTFSVSAPLPATLPPGGGDALVTVTTQSGCYWNANSRSSAVTMFNATGFPGTPGPGFGPYTYGTGSGQVLIRVPYGEGPNRSTDIFVAGKRVDILQQGYGCNPQYAPAFARVPAAGGQKSISIADISGCPFSFTTPDPWLSFVGPSSGTSGGIVNYQAQSNSTCAPREGSIVTTSFTHRVIQPTLPCLNQIMYDRVAVFRNGFFWLQDTDGNREFTVPQDRAFAFGGLSGDIPISGDWNGDGRAKVGIYRSANGTFLLDYNGDGLFTQADRVYDLGVGKQPGDVPVVGDWNADGRTKVGLFRQGFFWILDLNGDGVFKPIDDRADAFGGVAGDVPVVGDWNGDGRTKIGLFRQGFFWILDANGNGALDLVNAPFGDLAFAFGGLPGDVPVVGDWTGDGFTKVGVFRMGFFWVLDANNDYQFTGTGLGQDWAFPFGGIAGDKPVIGKW